MPRPVLTARRAVVAAAGTLALLAACSSGPGSPAETPAESAPAVPFSVSSADFATGEELAEEFTAAAFAGQCKGENRNPELSWEGAPEGTASFAVTMIDVSANDFVHWVHAGIPADVTSVAQGAAAELAGVAGQSATGQFGYFGPCPPTPDHEYVFTVHALDVEPDLATGFRLAELEPILAEHTLATASITGLRSGPAL